MRLRFRRRRGDGDALGTSPVLPNMYIFTYVCVCECICVYDAMHTNRHAYNTHSLRDSRLALVRVLARVRVRFGLHASCWGLEKRKLKLGLPLGSPLTSTSPS